MYSNSTKMVTELRRARLPDGERIRAHGASQPEPVRLGDVADYVIRGVLPAVGTVCQQDEQPFDPPS
jgi:hypothetical protein